MSNEILPNPRVGRRVVVVLALAIALDTIGQLLWKVAAGRLPASLEPAVLFHAVTHDPLPLLVIGVFLLQLVNWLLVLERVDLSYAQPLTAISYVSVGLLSTWFLGERMDTQKLIGILLVLAGVALVSASSVSASSMRRDKT